MHSKINCKVLIIIVCYLLCFSSCRQSAAPKAKPNTKKEITAKGSTKSDATNQKVYDSKEKVVAQKKNDSIAAKTKKTDETKNDSISKANNLVNSDCKELILVLQKGIKSNEINSKNELKIVQKKLNQIYKQGKPESFFKKFIDNSINQWLYDTIFGNSDKTGFSLIGKILTIISLLFQLGVMIIRSIKCFMKIDSEPKRFWCWVFALNWVFLVASFLAGSYQSLKQDERYTAQMHQEVTTLLTDHSQFFVELKSETQKTSAMLAALNDRTKNMSTLSVATLRAELQNNQKQVARQQEAKWNAQLQLITTENTRLKEQLTGEIEDNATSVFWFLLLLVVLFYKHTA